MLFLASAGSWVEECSGMKGHLRSIQTSILEQLEAASGCSHQLKLGHLLSRAIGSAAAHPGKGKTLPLPHNNLAEVPKVALNTVQAKPACLFQHRLGLQCQFP